jgi:CBS domain-containing protein
VNALLDACGFPLCRGGIMASNPQWCLAAPEWRARFGDWLRNPQPEALLHASVFFDLRAVGGRVELADPLLAWLGTEAPTRAAFLHQLARNALQTRPPLGLFGGLAGSGRGRDPAAIDLKLHGTRLFVDAARVMALARGATVAGTVARLRAATGAGGLPQAEAEAAIDAFQILQQLRLRMQLGDPAGVEGEPNAVRPDALNEFDRRVLKEALQQARRLQQTLAADWQV